jgi:hypothetical protein
MKALTLHKTSDVQWGDVAKLTLIALVCFLCVVALSRLVDWFGRDWIRYFWPATRALLAGQSPYSVEGFYNPPWALLPLIPFTVLPAEISAAVLATISLLCFAFAAHKMGASPIVLALFVFSPHVLKTSLNGNNDALVALGLVLPPQIGLFLVLLKPQIGWPVALFWLWQAWKAGRLREVGRVFAPVGAAFIASFLLYGFWPLHTLGTIGRDWNISSFPFLIPFGLAILYHALKTESVNLALLSAPTLTPYFSFISLPVPLLGLLSHRTEAIAAILGLWLVQIITGSPF